MQKEIVIKPTNHLLAIDLSELWQYRELLYVLAWRDIKVRYKQTLLGVLWVIFQPLVTTGIFSVFFGKIAKIPSDNLPYPLFVFVGLTVWNFFSNGLSNSGQSLMANEGIVKKVYFPRLVVPLAAIVTAGVDFLITLLLLCGAIWYYGYTPNAMSLFIFPPLVLILLLTMSGLGFFTSALNVKYRDVRYALGFFIQTGLFITPVIYPLSVIYDFRKWFLMLNPLSSVIEVSRALIANTQVDWPLIVIDLLVASVIFFLGLLYFRKTEGFFADTA